MPYNLIVTPPAALGLGVATFSASTLDGSCGSALQAVQGVITSAALNPAYWSVTCSANPVVSGTTLLLKRVGNVQTQTLTVTSVTASPDTLVDVQHGVSLFAFAFTSVFIMYLVGLAVGAVLSVMRKG